jgi:penicillin-binding protein-related factor A (putative recombinase)
MTDETDIRNAALDYIEGWYEGNVERMQKAVHSKLVKRRFVSPEEIWALDAPSMINITKEGRGKLPDPSTGKKEISILAIDKNMASVKIVSDKFVDYLHLLKENNQWRIVDALWDYIE